MNKAILGLMANAVMGMAFAQGQPPQPSFTELKAYLGLTDSQIQTIQQTRQTVLQANAALRDQAAAKQDALRKLLDAGSTDAAAIGRLVLESEALHKQIRTSMTALQTQLVNALTADQKTKLKALEDAAKLAPSIQQANMLGLLQPPADRGAIGPGVRGAGGPGFGSRGGRAPGAGMGRGPAMRMRQ